MTKGRIIERLRSLFASSATVFAISKTYANASIQDSIRCQLRDLDCTLYCGKLSLAKLACPYQSLSVMLSGDIGLVFCPTRDAALGALRVVWNTTEYRYITQGETTASDIVIKPGRTSLLPGQTTFVRSFGLRSTIHAGKIHIDYRHTVLEKNKRATPELVRFLKLLGMPTVHVAMKPVFYFDVETGTLDLNLSRELKLDTTEFEILEATSQKLFMPTMARALSLVKNMEKIITRAPVEGGDDEFSDSDDDTDPDSPISNPGGLGIFDDEDW